MRCFLKRAAIEVKTFTEWRGPSTPNSRNVILVLPVCFIVYLRPWDSSSGCRFNFLEIVCFGWGVELLMGGTSKQKKVFLYLPRSVSFSILFRTEEGNIDDKKGRSQTTRSGPGC